ncbi:hypothetical protein PsYK624_011760 [Phanerochaete sordida]|uniref:Uncharacterized protein n=1 Tax=Phanerochaete sordida TaxID=48140 RepID=A0A9P3FZQ6_9APHY|nr:hypothetical protein PsYK624_011760 [Phanerochaete sordida]
MPSDDEDQASGEEEFDLGDDDGFDNDAEDDVDDPIKDPRIRTLLVVPKLPSSTASIDVLREALSELQLQYAELASKYREAVLENVEFKAATKKQRNRYGGKPPRELQPYADRIYVAGKKSIVFFEVWTADDAFDAKTRPNIDLRSSTRYANPRNQQRARQAEVFDAIGGWDLEKNRRLADAMGSVTWIKRAYLAAAQQQRSHIIDDAKKLVYLCLPEALRNLPFDDLEALREDKDAALLRGGADNLMPPFAFPLDHNGNTEYMMRSPILVRLLIACLVGKSGLTTRRVWNASGTRNARPKPRKGKAAVQKGGQKSKAEIWGAVGEMRPEFMAFAFIVCRFLLSGDATFVATGSYNYSADFDWWKELLIAEWDLEAVKITRLWWEACVWQGHNPDVLELEAALPLEELTPAQRRTEALLTQLRNPSRASAIPNSISSPRAASPSPSPSPSSSLPAPSSSRTGSAAPASRTTGGAVSAASARSRTATQAAPKPDSDMSDVDDAAVEDLEDAIAAMDVGEHDGARAEHRDDDVEPALASEPPQEQQPPKPKKRVPKPAANAVEEDRPVPKQTREAASKDAEVNRPSSSRRSAAAAPEDQVEEPLPAAKATGRPRRTNAGVSRKKTT